ncbi:tRNA (mnm(5)s(2)U34)-methyltransferase [Anaerostipes sp.]|uniref:tRNA (mnm(5)s(2)U34)-methyltransferase n=1 Tax=Anaerostipes sp. TaxID=1872530 RepID=UPI0025BA2969|nr:class I SAM-dependent methyltransferase [Anaerostipes sp.]MBS7009770.1 class I SAM-dependent methyltransferase [Anaerostipes sp.]
MRISITQWVHQELERFIKQGDLCIDATVGKGRDTEFLCSLTSRVIGFDIQGEALETAKSQLNLKGYHPKLIQESHEYMGRYAEKETVQAILFNLGYLPGGDHSIATRPESTIKAVSEGLELLKTGGVISLCIYSGGDSGFEERDRVLEYLKQLDERKYFVVKQDLYNKSGHSPLPVLILKL